MSGIKNKQILIVEDEHRFRYSISLVLRSAGITVGEASDGLEALQILTQAQKISQKIDLLILDLQLPKLNGLELIDELKRLNYFVPTLIISGNFKKTQLQQLKAKGRIDYLRKPFNPDQLLKRVHSVFNENKSIEKQRLNGVCH